METFPSVLGIYGSQHDFQNKVPFTLTCAIYATGLGCLLFVLPQGLVGRYEPLASNGGLTNGEVCRLSGNGTSEFCFADYGGRWYYIFIFFLAQLLMGAGTTPLYTLGPTYIDENVHPKSSPVYLAVFFAMSTLGPGLGFISGGSLLNIYIDVTQVIVFSYFCLTKVDTWIVSYNQLINNKGVQNFSTKTHFLYTICFNKLFQVNLRSIRHAFQTRQSTTYQNDTLGFLRSKPSPLLSRSGRRGGLVVSALDSGSRGPGSSPGRVIVLCSWARHFTPQCLSPPGSINGYQQTVRET